MTLGERLCCCPLALVSVGALWGECYWVAGFCALGALYVVMSAMEG